MSKPYIGIVGVKDLTEAEDAARISRYYHTRTNSHIVQIGVQVTVKSLRGEVNQNRRNPLVWDIGPMFDKMLTYNPEIFTVVHFTPKDTALIVPGVQTILGITQMITPSMETCRGIQINGQFDKITPYQLEQIKKLSPRLKIILQLHGAVLEVFSHQRICNTLFDMQDLVDYALIDPSGGRGQELDVIKSSYLALRIINSTSVSVGIAGGLKGDNVGRIVGELRRLLGMNNFSIDAEGGLRDKVGEGYGNDDFNIQKARAYFENAVKAFS